MSTDFGGTLKAGKTELDYMDTAFGYRKRLYAVESIKLNATDRTLAPTGPGLDYASIFVIRKGTTVVFNGEVFYDIRGVAWYQVYYNYRDGWVSSRYTSLK